MKDKLILIGAGGHGKVAADIAIMLSYKSIALLDDNFNIKSCAEYPVKGKYGKVDLEDSGVFVTIGNAAVRQKIQEQLQKSGFVMPVFIHPNTIVVDIFRIGKGTILYPYDLGHDTQLLETTAS